MLSCMHRRSKYEHLAERCERSESRHDQRHRELETEVERLRPLATSVATLREQIATRDDQLQASTRDITDHSHRVRDLEQKLAEQSRTIESLNTLQSAHTALMSKKDTEVAAANERASRIDTSIMQLRDNHASEIRQLQQTIHEAKSRYADAMDGERLAAEHARAAATRAAEAEVWAARAASHVPACERCGSLEKQLNKATKGHLRDIHSLESRLESLQTALAVPSPSHHTSHSSSASHAHHSNGYGNGHMMMLPHGASAAAQHHHGALSGAYSGPPTASEYRQRLSSLRSP